MKRNKKPLLIGALAVLLAVLVVGGTVAWLTASSHVTNTFTVGEIKPPADTDDDDDQPDNPPKDPDSETEETKFSGNIYEIFDKDPIIIPDSSITKKPYIGVGADSEPAYVFAYVQNKMDSSTADIEDYAHFTLGKGWQAVKATPYMAGTNVASTTDFVGGLFVWCGTDGTAPTTLNAKDGSEKWTSPLFESVDFSASINASDFVEDPTMNVYCYLYAAVSGATYDQAKNAALDWVDNNMPASSGTATTNGN